MLLEHGVPERFARHAWMHASWRGGAELEPVLVALADKLDTLTGFWAIDEKPTGSKDPFALRRAALGVVRIVLENGLRLKTSKLNKG